MDAAQPELNHINLLQHRAKNSGNTVLFKLPISKGSEGPPQAWKSITVAEFAAEVDRVANFLLTELNGRSIHPRSAVSVLCEGSQYEDIVYVIALARASYIPHLCPMLTHPAVVLGLMEKAGSKILLYDPSLAHLTVNCPFPKLALKPMDSIKASPTANGDSALPSSENLPSSSDIGLILLTSGSTSGSPKVVPVTHEVLNLMTRTGISLNEKSFDTQDVLFGFDTLFSRPAMIQYFKCLQTGSCLIRPFKGPLSNEYLLNMVHLCGLNHIATYGTWIVPHIQAAKKNPAILKLLQGMRKISYTGMAMSHADDDWCFQNGISIVSSYGTTEIGCVMISVPGKPSRYIRPVPGVLHRFDPVTDTTLVDNPASSQLFEFVLLSDSPQIPQAHLLSTDGNYRTGDLFERHPDESYIFRGRNDDWIKTMDADRADAKAIQDHIHETCSDLVKESIVVGNLRPSPALFVEVLRGTLTPASEDALKESIIQRMGDFNSRQYQHEQIKDKRLIVLVDEGVLPRTQKGSFRRRAIEEKYAKELDAIYISVYGS